jgi:hypothetical protein
MAADGRPAVDSAPTSHVNLEPRAARRIVLHALSIARITTVFHIPRASGRHRYRSSTSQ